MFPYYLAIGMTYDQFWNDDCELAVFYRKAAEIKKDLKNQEAWLQGAYFYEAIIDASPVFNPYAKKGTKPSPYRSEPYDFRSESTNKRQSKEDQSMKNTRSFMEAFMVSNNKKYEHKGGEAIV